MRALKDAYKIVEDTQNLERIYEIKVSPHELSDRKMLKRMLKEIAEDVEKHKKSHLGWKYRINANEISRELIEESIKDFRNLFVLSPKDLSLLALIGATTGFLIGYYFFPENRISYALAAAILSGNISSVTGLALDFYLSNKNWKRYNLLKELIEYK